MIIKDIELIKDVIFVTKIYGDRKFDIFLSKDTIFFYRA